MPDITYNQFPISGKIVDFDTLQSDVNNLNANAVLESRTINGYDLSENRTIYAQDVPSRNLLPNMMGSAEEKGVIFTVNADGSISTSGTASSGIQRTIGSITLKAGTNYYLGGCPSGGDLSTYFINFSGIVNDFGSGATYQPTSDTTTNAVININSGVNMSGKTFYPIVRIVGTPSAYVPYAKTNVELTKDIAPMNNVITTGSVSKAITTSWADTGLSITIPVAGYYAIIAQLSYSNNIPRGVALITRGTNTDSVFASTEVTSDTEFGQTVGSIRCSCVVYVNAGDVIRLCAKTKTAGNNNCIIYAKQLV